MLREHCSADPELLKQVQRLLDAADKDNAENPLDAFVDAFGPSETRGNQISDGKGPSSADQDPTTVMSSFVVGGFVDRYRLMEQLGEGGMGVVYVAEQIEPVRRKVALKVIKPGMDSKQVIARFEAERQALALMDHVNIARVLDAGTTEQGLPYFVMELVRGLPISEYCDKSKSNTSERLNLFVDVCNAVHHAHQKGVIHRDIKPSNVLVTLHDGKPVVKVIDFGVAKSLHQHLSRNTVYTALNQILGTPLYMSPEQLELSGLDIDVRSDIYSLGVLLYELLTGTTPFDRDRLMKSGFDEMRRIIREEDPPKPSHRITTLPKAELSTCAKKRGLDERTFTKSVQNELDWITLKALEKDRNRRYDSAKEMANDVHRYLKNDTVLACPPSLAYRAAKFARRNRAVLSTAIFIAIALCVGMAGTLWQAIRATYAEGQLQIQLANAIGARELADQYRKVADEEAEQARNERARAVSESAKAEAINDFLLKDLLYFVSTDNQLEANLLPDKDISLKTLLDRASENLAGKFADQPDVKSTLHHTIGQAYQSIGSNENAERNLRAAVDVCVEAIGPDAPGTLRAKRAHGVILLVLGQSNEAEKTLTETLRTSRHILGDESSDTVDAMNSLVYFFFEKGRFAEAKPLAQEALQISKRLFGIDHPQTEYSMRNLAAQLDALGEGEEAEKIASEAHEIAVRIYGSDHPRTLHNLRRRAVLAFRGENYRLAQKLFETWLAGIEPLYHDDHPEILDCHANLARIELRLGRIQDAEVRASRTYAKSKKVYGIENGETAFVASTLIEIYMVRGRTADALSIAEEAKLLDIKRETGENDYGSMQVMASLMQKAGRHDEAEKFHLAAIECLKRSRGENHESTLTALNNIGVFYQGTGRNQEAYDLFDKIRKRRNKTDGPDAPSTLSVSFNIGYVLFELGRRDEAYAILEDTLDRSIRTLGVDNDRTKSIIKQLPTFMISDERLPDRYGKAEAFYRKLVGLYDPSKSGSRATTREAQAKVAEMLFLQRKDSVADAWLDDMVKSIERDNNASEIDKIATLETAASAHRRQMNATKALPLYKEIYERRSEALGVFHVDTKRSIEPLTWACKTSNQLDFLEALLRSRLSAAETSGAPIDLSSTLYDLARLLIAKTPPTPQQPANEATSMLRSALALLKSTDEDLLQRLSTINTLASIHTSQCQFSEAEDLLRQIANAHETKYGKNSQLTQIAMNRLASNLAMQEEYSAAVETLQRLIESVTSVDGTTLEHNKNLRNTLERNLLAVYLAQNDLEAAEQLTKRITNFNRESRDEERAAAESLHAIVQQLQGHPTDAVARLEGVLSRKSSDPLAVTTLRLALAEIYIMQEKIEAAEEQIQLLLDEPRHAGNAEKNKPRLLYYRGLVHALTHRYDEAEPFLSELANYANSSPFFQNNFQWMRHASMSILGEILSIKGEHEQAEKMLLRGYEGMEQHLDVLKLDQQRRAKEFSQAATRLANHYRRVSDSEKVELWQEICNRWLAKIKK